MEKTLNSISEEKFSLASFFAGVGGIELGFEKTGKFNTVYANEFDKNAQITYSENFENVLLDKRDIREVEPKDVPNVDVITGGFPCQAFSIAGYRKGFEDERGNLFFDLLRLIKSKNPQVIFIENVKNMVTHDNGNTFKVIREALVLNGYFLSWKVLNSAEYGNIPQNRERIYIVGFRDKKIFEDFNFPEPIELETTIHNVIDFDNEKHEDYYYKKGKQPFYDIIEKEITSKNSIYQWRRKYVRENKSGLVPTLTANMGTGGHNVPLIYTDYGLRKLTPRETFNIQGYPQEYKLPELAKSHLYKQVGNSVTVPVIERIAEKVADAMINNKQVSDLFKPLNGKKYAIIYLDIYGRYSGTSYVVEYFHTITEIEEFIENNATTAIPYLSDEAYGKLIKNGVSGQFYMSIPL